MAGLIYREHEPIAALRSSVQSLWELAGPCDEVAPQLVVPDGCVSLVINFGAVLQQLADVGSAALPPKTSLIGEIRRPLTLQSNGGLDLVGVRFWPGTAQRFIDTPITQILGRISDESCLRTTLSRHIARDVHGADRADRMRLLQAALASSAQPVSGGDSVVVRATVQALFRQAGRVRIDALAAKFGSDRRRLERHFIQQVGILAKSLANVLRFRRALAAVTTRSSSWAEISLECGYYDQSHLIRDFKRFTGLTPGAYRAKHGSLTALRIEAGTDSMSHFSNTG